MHFGTGVRGPSLPHTKSVEYPSFAALAVDSQPTGSVVNTDKFSSRNNPTAAGLICTRTDRLFVILGVVSLVELLFPLLFSVRRRGVQLLVPTTYYLTTHHPPPFDREDPKYRTTWLLAT